MIRLIDILIILISHYIGDFVCQSRSMSDSKSKNIYWLLTHGAIYILVMFTILCIFTQYQLNQIFIYVMINGLLHIVIDQISSINTTKFYKKNNFYGMFTIIGLDQLLHTSILILTAYLLLY
jgi:hypothetical protein